MRLESGWELSEAAPGEPPGDAWRPATVPGTVASALHAPLDGGPDLEERDWWYRCRFPAEPGRARLRFDGLATVAEGWLNGRPILRSHNMFLPLRCPVQVERENELLLCFRALAPLLREKRPRPRWRTALVVEQNLRWFRTSLLGRIPGWTPRLPAIGPWRSVGVEPDEPDTVVRAWVDGDRARLQVSGPGDRLRVEDRTFSMDGALDLDLGDAARWWPHTHGEPRLHAWEVRAGDRTVARGRVGFRTIELDRSGGGVTLRVNGVPVFARGACWSATDVRSIDGRPGETAARVRTARDGGANCLRIGGTMAWGSDELYDACDELGVLVWQDLMLANMDYPFADAAFAADLDAEVSAQLERIGGRPSLAVLCGGSEIEQQAAMLGLPPDAWCVPWLRERLPALVADHRVPVLTSTPTGGALPIHTSVGVSHYYGVGAYRRPLSDARASRVRFTAECLGFSNVPDEAAVERAFGTAVPATHTPAWKAGVPRDSRAGWDFEDVRDHYLRAHFGVDPVALRSTDPERYLALSRVVTGEVMTRVYAEWRRPGSGCAGGLVWLLQDLRPGAGWGILDEAGAPKAAWWALRRAWAPRAVLLTDEGLDGVDLHVFNETADALDGEVELALYRGRQRVGGAAAPVALAPGESRTLQGDALIGRFADLAWAYRFGPPPHEVVVATLRWGGGQHRDCLFPAGWALPRQPPGTLRATRTGDEIVTLEADAFLQWVRVSSPGWTPSDNGFHLPPGRAELRVTCTGDRPLRLQLTASNLEGEVGVR
jgi:beta-mannosidase